MRKVFILSVLLLLYSGLLVDKSFAVSAYPYPVKITQRDGTKITVIMQGDERVKWAKTTDGYALIYNSQGIYEYAKQDASGDMVPSGVKARDILERTQQDFTLLTSTPKNLAFSQSQLSVMKQTLKFLKSSDPEHAFPTTGNRKLLCILMGFTDQGFTKTRSDLENLFNQVGYQADGATGSVKDFFNEASYNKLSLTVDVVGPFTADKTMAYYGNNTDGDPRELITEAVQKADPTVDFASYDNDGDGYSEGVYIIFAGYGEESGGGADCIWSHAWAINPITCDGIVISDYSCSPELRGNYLSGISRIGVICHELGHILGAPDFYDTDYSTGGQFNGTGCWDLQSNGSWNNTGTTPAHPNPYTKIYLYNWATVTTLSSQATIILKDAASFSSSFFRFNTLTPGEYYLMENRQNIGFDAYTPGHGLIIYHVHKDIESLYGTNTINATYPQMLYPVCASAVSDPNETPSSYGDVNSQSCPFPGKFCKTAFTDATIPSQRSWQGEFTDKPITNITEDLVSKTITFSFMGNLDPDDPSELKGNPVSSSQINLNWKKNGSGNPVMIAVNSSTTFGKPFNGSAYSPGNDIPGGGRIIYVGEDTLFSHTGLTGSTTYVYKAWSVLAGNSYSLGIMTDAMTIPSDVCENDYLALVALYNKCNGPHWNYKSNWLTGPVYMWEGVRVENNRVVKLYLNSPYYDTPKGLTGSLPVELSNLTGLRELFLYNNLLSGPLPETLSALVNLELLDLSKNQFTGPLPSSWSSLTKLVDLNLSRNQLTGTLPPNWSSLRNILYVNLEFNHLSGTLPDVWSELLDVKRLELDCNYLTGRFPAEWSVLMNLELLNLRVNQFTDSVPDSWSGLINLQWVDFSSNQISGLPDLSPLTKLGWLNVRDNLLDFGDIELNINVSKKGFYYSPQGLVGQADTLVIPTGEEFRISVSVGGVNNQYQWYKNGDPIAGAKGSEYVISNVDAGDPGIYTCQITNTLVPDLTLTSQPVTLQISTIQQSKLLSTGWTWFSLNVASPDMSIGNVLKSLKPTQLDYIKNQTVSATYYSGTGWFGDLTQIDPKEMYKIKLAAADTLIFEGVPVDLLTNQITIKTGWNWIGYLPQSPESPSKSLPGYSPEPDDYIKNQTVSSTYYNDFGWFGYLNEMKPGEGYMFRAGHDGVIQYLAGDPPIPGWEEDGKTLRPEDYKTLRREDFEYSGQVTATIYLDGQNFDSENYCLYSVVSGKIRGVSRGMWFEPGKVWIHNHLTYSNLSEGDTIRFRLHDSVSDTWYEFKEFVIFKADMLIANALDPFVLKNSSLLEPWALSPEPSLSVWPNPVNYHATINYIITTDQPVVIEVIDFSGRVVDELALGNQKAGEHLNLWNTETLEPGIYYLRMKGIPVVFTKAVVSK